MIGTGEGATAAREQMIGQVFSLTFCINCETGTPFESVLLPLHSRGVHFAGCVVRLASYRCYDCHALILFATSLWQYKLQIMIVHCPTATFRIVIPTH